ncbi:MAG: hydantoinase/oxoprolinase family protein, partial [Rhodospirillaceae bacterium]|nr:hydantoinase/oxoprolinase family protein [Rhodospirillaceae bacterium]
NVESTIIGRVDKPGKMKIAPGKGADQALKGTRDMVFSATNGAQEINVYDGALLGAGDELEGPAVIEEVTTTIVIEPGWRVCLHESGVYVLTTQSSDASAKNDTQESKVDA